MAADSKGSLHTGIAISDEAIAAVQVRVTRDSFQVVRARAIEAQKGSVDQNAVHDAAAVAAAVRRLKKEIGMSGQAGVAALSPAYNMRTLRLPDVPTREQRTLVRGELEQLGALSKDSGALDVLWISGASHEGARQADASVYFTTDAVVDDTRKALQQAGVPMGRIEPGSLAFMRSYLAARTSQEPVALLLPSDKHTDLLVHDGVRVRHVRRIPAGISDLGQVELSSLASMPGIEAPAPFTEIDSEFELPDPSGGQTLVGSAVQTAGPIAGTDYAASNGNARIGTSFLESEVARSMAFYSRESDGAAVPESVVLLAPKEIGSRLEATLSASLAMPVSTFDPFALLQEAGWTAPPGVRISPELAGSALGVALGAGGFEAGIPKIDVSLQEKAATIRRRAPVVLMAGMAASAAWMLVAAVAGIWLTIQNGAVQSEDGKITSQIRAINEERAPAVRHTDLLNAAYAAKAKSQVPAMSVMGRVADAAVKGVSLSRLAINPGGRVQMEGNATLPALVEEFERSLSHSQAIKGAVLESLKKGTTGGWTFKIGGMTRPKQQQNAQPGAGL